MVHKETVAFLRGKHEQLSVEYAEWTLKYEADCDQKQKELQKLSEQRSQNLIKLESLQKRWKEEVELQKSKENEKRRLKELEVLKREEEKKQAVAVRKIQAAYRMHRTILEEKRLAIESAKKVKKKGGGGKKKK